MMITHLWIFVVDVLRKFFHKEFLAAEAIMLKIHIDGEAVCGHIVHYDVAQTKVSHGNRIFS